MARRQVCYYCARELSDADMVIKAFPLATKGGIRMYKRKFHYDCLPKYAAAEDNMTARRQENSDWDQVYRYFRDEILGLKPGQVLSKHTVERLKGLRVGLYKPGMHNARTTKRGYSFKTIVNTLKFCKRSIESARKRVHFKNEDHEIDYIMKIVSNNVNFISKRMDEVAAQNRRIERIKREEPTTTPTAAYQRKGTGRRKVVFN